MICYKVVDAALGRPYRSACIMGKLQCCYRIGKKTRAHPKMEEMGFGLCVFKRKKDAVAFADDFYDDGMRVLRCEGESMGAPKWISPHLIYERTLALTAKGIERNRIPASKAPLTWPKGTWMVSELTPIKEVY